VVMAGPAGVPAIRARVPEAQADGLAAD